jgi:23S rRNA (adenine(2503)-C(2))-methyltransferase
LLLQNAFFLSKNFMNLARIKEIVEKYKLKTFKQKQLAEGFLKQFVADFDEITTLSKEEKILLKENEKVLSFELYKIFASSEKNAYKALLKLNSTGKLIETVLLNPKPNLWSTCISSQVGCAMACSFCATGTMGFLQNLTAEEISDQVLFWKQYIKKENICEKNGTPAKLSNVVYMGMGEPMANLTPVLGSVAELIDENGLNLSARNISISTSGLVPGIEALAERFPQVNLALSLHSANNALRSKLMPVANKAFPLEKLAETLRKYMNQTGRKIFLEYILLDGENDRQSDALELADWVKKLNMPHLTHVNLIVYNKTDSDHQESTRENARLFKETLKSKGISATIRKNLGRDIMAACGQLVIKQKL